MKRLLCTILCSGVIVGLTTTTGVTEIEYCVTATNYTRLDVPHCNDCIPWPGYPSSSVVCTELNPPNRQCYYPTHEDGIVCTSWFAECQGQADLYSTGDCSGNPAVSPYNSCAFIYDEVEHADHFDNGDTPICPE